LPYHKIINLYKNIRYVSVEDVSVSFVEEEFSFPYHLCGIR